MCEDPNTGGNQVNKDLIRGGKPPLIGQVRQSDPFNERTTLSSDQGPKPLPWAANKTRRRPAVLRWPGMTQSSGR